MKLTLGLNTLCNWILDFLTNKLHMVGIGGHTSSTQVLTGGCQGKFETSYHVVINNLAGWYAENSLMLNVSQTKELIVDFRKKEMKSHTPVEINGAEVEGNSFRFLGISITENLSWSSHISTLVKKDQKQLF